VPELIAQHWALTGTVANCAGGITPWNAWMTAEEDIPTWGAAHGYVFEAPNDTTANNPAAAVALTGLGRFRHEACAMDPSNGYVYQTEDNSSRGDIGVDVSRVIGRLDNQHLGMGCGRAPPDSALSLVSP
jgi:secreted PhoX family phosphatase